MKNQGREATGEGKQGLVQQAAQRQREKLEAQGVLAPRRDPTEQLSCRLGDSSCAQAHASTLSRATAGKEASATTSLLRLQQGYGNRFVQQVLVQAGRAPGEHEATPEVEQGINRARGGGQPLDSTTRAQMEPAFGADFGGVRVHTSAPADELNRSLNARAFTTGQDVFFRQGAYNPGSSSGRELIAHELTHVVQQNGDKLRRKLSVGQPNDRFEQEAERMSRQVMEQEGQIRRAADGAVVQRQEEDEDTPLTQASAQRQEEDLEEE